MPANESTHNSAAKLEKCLKSSLGTILGTMDLTRQKRTKAVRMTMAESH
jgi:hypothetical protein